MNWFLIEKFNILPYVEIIAEQIIMYVQMEKN